QVFFPTHGGKEYEHYYVFGVDFGRREKFILNSLPCQRAFQTDVVFKPTGTRLMMYVRPFLQERLVLISAPFLGGSHHPQCSRTRAVVACMQPGSWSTTSEDSGMKQTDTQSTS
ncbi:hypothetical protein LINPERPRIM_LOCUS33537, partial [Linum perenne]